ncbi:HAMP domain-containing histidine kinase [Cohnella nanjingensis]|uniref:Heme sensor protein HssS n=1 Tax=Cohnella nanjingensis TaxID=1387779 RepID=A0A7X0VID9_9BACL|nr:HAMP domain-containing histidine kinase [Cohnella nanjingensis]
MVSLFLSLILINRLYENQIRSYVQDNLIKNGKEIIESYIDSYPSHSEMLVKGIAAVSASNAVNIYGPDGKLLHSDVLTGNKYISLNDEAIEFVLKGGLYRNQNPHGPQSMIVGLPFQIGQEKFALFLAPSLGPFLKLVARFIQIALLLVMFFGSLFILVAAQFIVRPLKRLTSATRRMSKGDFRIEMRTKRKDEIGQLTRSFNAMAQELGTLERIRQQFVSNVSHEIQSPLTSIKGFTQALKHKKMDEASRLRLLGIIEEETERLSRLGEDLLQLSSLEYEHLQLNRQAYRLDEQLRKAVIALEPQWAPKEIRIALALEEIDVVADEDKLFQLWSNLLGNAIKFSETGGEIQLTAIRRGDTATVSVRDNGAGIPESEWDLIFRPFYKVDPSRARTVPGNGIGLSIVKRIVDLHHGDIRVASRPGEGTTFTVSFRTETSDEL